MFPPEEGVWGKRGSPIVRAARASGGWVVGLFGNVSAEAAVPGTSGGRSMGEPFEGVGRMPSASKLVCVREGIGMFDVQHKLTYRSGEAERGGGSIYGDGSVQSAQVRLRTRPTFQSVWWVVSYCLLVIGCG